MWWVPKEPFSCYSHLLGALLSIVGLVALIAQSVGNPWHVVGFAVYGASLILLYSASTIYHWLVLSPRGDDLLQRFDHAAIFVLIAGSYTPVCLVTLRGGWGWSLFGVVWGVALAGVTLKLFFEHIPRWSTTALYIGMGWIAIVAVVPLVRSVNLGGVMWLLAGGVLYTVGALIYAVRRPDPFPDVFGFHEVFHLFVLAGSVVHFAFMMRYVAPVT
jgi:hemolysin III